jgi:hypothetical protein
MMADSLTRKPLFRLRMTFNIPRKNRTGASLCIIRRPAATTALSYQHLSNFVI